MFLRNGNSERRDAGANPAVGLSLQVDGAVHLDQKRFNSFPVQDEDHFHASAGILFFA